MLRRIATLLSMLLLLLLLLRRRRLLVWVAWRASSWPLEVVGAASASATVTVVEASALRVLRLHALDLSGRRIWNGARNVLWGIVDVKTLVNGLRNGLDLSPELLLDAVKVESVLPVDQVNSETKVTKATGSTDTMKIGLCIFGEIKVDNDVDSLDINTTSEKIGANKVTAVTSAEIVEDAVTVLLEHTGVRVEAGIAELGNLLCEKLNASGRVAEDDGLVDLQTGEERVQTVDLLLLLDKGIVLSNTAKSKFVHEVDLVRVVHVLVLEVLDNDRKGGGEEHNLAVGGVEGDELVDGGCEFGRQELVSLVHDERLGG